MRNKIGPILSAFALAACFGNSPRAAAAVP